MSNTKKDNIEARNLHIRRLAAEWASAKENGVQKYSNDCIMARLRKRFHLGNRTIHKILKGH